MKKPLNKVALALWIVVVLFVLGEIWTYVSMLRALTSFHEDDIHVVGEGLVRTIQSVIATAAMLTALGARIELVDQIRWTIVRAVEKS